MADRKVYPLRIEQRLYDALERWAADDLRSVNAQIEFLLRESLRRAGRLPRPDDGQRGRAGDGERGGKGERGGPRG
jgi:hypothetical protein